MKLCRFELKSEPGSVRSGMVYSGKIYETSGAEAVAVHEADAVRPLSPIPNAPSVRVVRSDLQPGILAGIDLEDPFFFYINPTTLAGASQIIAFPEAFGEVSVECYLAAVVVSDGYQLSVETAEDIILGYTLCTLVVSKTAEAAERRVGAIGRSHDLGGVIGPVLTTPDEIENSITRDENGRRYSLEAVIRVNQVERARGNAEDLPFSAAQVISAASYCSPVRAGDIFCLGPISTSDEPIVLEPGDEVHLAVENLGTLALKLGR